MKIHTARAYKEMAIAAKSLSAAVQSRFEEWAEQDENTAESLFSQALAGTKPANYQFVPYPFAFDVDADGDDPQSVANGLIFLLKQVADAEIYTAAVFKEAGSAGFMKVCMARREEALRIIRYIENGGLFSSAREIEWQCRKCGSRFTAKAVPETCGCCGAEYTYFVRFNEIGE